MATPTPSREPSTPRRPGVTFGRLFDIELRADWSLLIVFALVLYSLGAGVFPEWHPDWSPMTVWATAFGAATLFFVSVLAHELSHALVARTQGVSVRTVTLFLFGGVAHMDEEPPSPKSEALIAIVGPLVSIAIGLAATVAGGAMASAQVSAEALGDPEETMAALSPATSLLLWLGPVNLVLGVFNLVPGFPLDGGRVLRALVWWKTGNLTRATKWAARAGRAFGFALVALGVVQLLGGAVGQGVWWILIGFFIQATARASYHQHVVRTALERLHVGSVMRTRVASITPSASVEELVREALHTGDQRIFPVETGGRLQGFVSLEAVERVPRERRSETRVRDLMIPLGDLPTLSPHDMADTALERLARQRGGQLPVVEEGEVRGLVDGADLFRWASLASSDEAPPAQPT